MPVNCRHGATVLMTAAAVLAWTAIYGSTGAAADDDTNRPDILVPVPPAGGRTIKRDSSGAVCVHPKQKGCVRTLRRALERAPAGGTIVVQSRTNLEGSGLILRKPVLLCAGETVAAKLECSKKTADRFTLNHNSDSSCITVDMRGPQAADIRGVEINVGGRTLPYACIRVKSGRLRLSDSSVRGATNNTGILIERSDAHILRSEITGNKDGIVILSRGHHVILTDSRISGHQHGVTLQGGTLTATGNRIENNDYAGIRIDRGRAVLVRNLISGNKGPGLDIHNYDRPARIRQSGALSQNFSILLLHNKFYGNRSSVEWKGEPIYSRRGGILPMQNCFSENLSGEAVFMREYDNYFPSAGHREPQQPHECDSTFPSRRNRGPHWAANRACHDYFRACVAPWPRLPAFPDDEAVPQE